VSPSSKPLAASLTARNFAPWPSSAYPDIYHAPIMYRIMSYGRLVSKASTTFSSNARGEGSQRRGTRAVPEERLDFWRNSVAIRRRSRCQNATHDEGLSRSQPPPQVRLFHRQAACRRVWELRENALGVTSHIPESP